MIQYMSFVVGLLTSVGSIYLVSFYLVLGMSYVPVPESILLHTTWRSMSPSAVMVMAAGIISKGQLQIGFHAPKIQLLREEMQRPVLKRLVPIACAVVLSALLASLLDFSISSQVLAYFRDLTWVMHQWFFPPGSSTAGAHPLARTSGPNFRWSLPQSGCSAPIALGLCERWASSCTLHTETSFGIPVACKPRLATRASGT